MAVRKNTKKHRRSGMRFSNVAVALVLATGLVISASILKGARNDGELEHEQTRIVAEYDTVDVPVPVSFVEAGTRIADINFKNIAFPVSQIPEGAILNLAGLEDSAVLAPLPANLPLFMENLNLKGGYVNPVIERIPAGMRAITIRVDATTVVEGWAGSGAIVDVLLVENDRSTVVAEQVKILSSERSLRPVAVEDMGDTPSTVTLLVSQEQALAINTAIPRGRLAFALRGFQDEANWDDRVFTSERFARSASGRNKAEVNGYVKVGDGAAYALSEGKWIPTQVKPQGFFASKQ